MSVFFLIYSSDIYNYELHDGELLLTVTLHALSKADDPGPIQ